MWQLAFVAMSVTLGESLDATLESLGDEARHATRLVNALRLESREARARALAEHLAAVAADVDALEVTWRV